MFSGLKIKLNVKKEPGDAAPSGQPGPSGAPPQPSSNNGAPVNAAGHSPPPIKLEGGSRPMIGANPTAPGGPPKLLKLKMPSGQMPNLTGPITMRPPGPKPASHKPKLKKRPHGSMQPNAGFHGVAPGGPSGGFSAPKPKKFKLGGTMGPPIKLKTTGTLNLAGAPIHHPHPHPPRPHSHQPLGSAHLPPRHPGGIPGPKKRGRKPKTDPDSLFQRQARMVDEVTYNIASPPPRAHSLRQSASQLTFDEDGVRPGASPLNDGMGLPFAAGDPMALGGGLPREDGGPAAAAAATAAPREPYVPEPYPTPNFPATPPTKEELSRLLSKIKEKDTIHIFHEPVTDAEAPGYTDVIATPMDLLTMRKKLEGGSGSYSDWPEFWEDLDLMFMNALTYNQPPDKIHGYALRLRKTVATMVSKVRANAKTAKDATKRAAAQKKAAAAKAERDAAARQARAELKAAQEAKVLKRAGVGDDGGEDLEARATYKLHATNPMAAVWGGLYGGCSVEGALFGRDKLLLKASNPIPSTEGYAASMLRFASGLVGRARELVTAKVNAARETRENVVPPTNPPHGVSNTAQQGKGGKKAKQQQQPAAAVLAPPPVSLFQTQQPPPVLGALPPVTQLTGINNPSLPGAMPTTMIQPTPAMAAAASAHMLASQAQAQVATTSGMQFVYQHQPQQMQQQPQFQQQQGMVPGQMMMMMPQPGQFMQPVHGGGMPQQQMLQQQHQPPMPMQGQGMYQQPQQQQYPGVPPR
ncbi:hypothetical protein Ndes2437B_g02039 [Nannochloris sp. 'desiccata']